MSATYKNKAHQAAFEAGQRARSEGKDRFAPYSADNRSSAYFRRAWLSGYDDAAVAAALAACVDAMLRSDPDSGLGPCTDQAWDAALAAGVAALAAIPSADGAA